MKVTSPISGGNTLWTPVDRSGPQAAGFQAALAAQISESKDTLTLSTPEGTGYVPPTPDFSRMTDSRKLAVLQRLHEQTDYSGMTEAEKYKLINERFSAAFDQLTLHTGIFGWPRTEKILLVHDQICKEAGIKHAYMGQVDHKLYREALYGDMSDDEVKAAVYNKYDGNTPYDRLSALKELSIMELDNGAFFPAISSFIERSLETCRHSRHYQGASTDDPSEIAYIRGQIFNTSMSWTELYDLTLSVAKEFGGTQVSFDKTIPVYDVVKKIMDEMMDDVMNLGGSNYV